MITDKLYKWTKYAVRDDLGTPIGIKEDAPDWAKKNYVECKKKEKEWEEQGVIV